MRSYAIGDIHGQLDLLRAAHARIAADRAVCADHAAPVIHIGDLVDRGPDSAGVLEFLASGVAAGDPWIVLRGNHDRMLSGFLDNPAYHDPGLRSELSWLNPRLGGAATLASYGVDHAETRPLPDVHAEARQKVPAAHRRLLAKAPLWHLRGEVLFVHAGIRPGVDLRDQVEDDLLWIRAPFLEDSRDHGALVIHGHTALDQATHFGNRVDIDSGAAFGGPLTAVVVEGRAVWELTDAGRRPLLPR
ncbi:serine/threonine protein phosphatase 1 [Rhodobacteraceae bacterium MBR-64]|jgi:serine/threonine protein phosphatase 1